MINIILRFLIIGLFSSLAACGGGGDDNDGDSGSGFKIYAESSQDTGVTVSVTGTWVTSCYINSGAYKQDTLTISSTGALTLIERAYSNDVCTTLSSITQEIPSSGETATLIVDVEPRTLLGWTDGAGTNTSASVDTGGIDAPPTADTSDGGTLLSNPPKVSQLDLDLSSIGIMNVSFYLDDTATTHVLYREYGADKETNGYTKYMTTADPFYKQ